jgi:membrane protein YqaA with SNARE-associated domain
MLQPAMDVPAKHGDSQAEEAPRQPRRFGWYLVVLSVLMMIGIAALAVIFKNDWKEFKDYGYLGAFVVSFMAGATVIVYVPGVPLVFALGGLLPYPFLVGIAAGLGEAGGEFTGYLAGRGSSTFLENQKPGLGKKLYSRAERWMKAYPYLTLFLASAVFNPFFDLIGATAGAARIAPWKFYTIVAAGKVVKGTYVAYLGMWGLDHILGWFNYEPL